jgi:hypothetical protein
VALAGAGGGITGTPGCSEGTSMGNGRLDCVGPTEERYEGRGAGPAPQTPPFARARHPGKGPLRAVWGRFCVRRHHSRGSSRHP